MVIQSIQGSTTQTQSTAFPQVGSMNDKSVVQFETSVARQSFKAGVGPGMFDGLGTALVLAAIGLATLCATAAVAFATRNPIKASITFGVGALVILATLAYDRFKGCRDDQTQHQVI